MTTKQQRDDDLIALLATGRSVAEAAAACGCSAPTVYRRLADPTFAVRLSAAKAAQWAGVTNQINSHVSRAVDVIRELMEGDEHPSTRLRAAVELARLALDFRRLNDVTDRVAVLEARLAEARLADHVTPDPD